MIKEWQHQGVISQVSPKSNQEQDSWERGKGKLSIKGGEVQQEKGFNKIERKDLRKNKREKVVIVEQD